MGDEVGVYPEKDLKGLNKKKRKQLKAACVRIIKSNSRINASIKRKLNPLHRRLKRSSSAA